MGGICVFPCQKGKGLGHDGGIAARATYADQDRLHHVMKTIGSRSVPHHSTSNLPSLLMMIRCHVPTMMGSRNHGRRKRRGIK